jgi:DNA-binding transcriptional regulator YdaS (Cro superfamily)
MLASDHELRRFGLKRLALLLGITHGAVSQWRRVPADRVVAVERVTGISRSTLRPDLYPPHPATPHGPAGDRSEQNGNKNDAEAA